MKSLQESIQESIFDKDLVTTDPFESILDHMNVKEYGKDKAVAAIEQLYDIIANNSKEYVFDNMGNVYFESSNNKELKGFIKELLKHKKDYILIFKDRKGEYVVGWINPRRWDLFDRWCIGNYMWSEYVSQWVTDYYYDTEAGAKEIVQHAAHYYTSCVLLTDKAKIKAIKKIILNN